MREAPTPRAPLARSATRRTAHCVVVLTVLGAHARADVVQERWNDGTLQVLLWTLLGASVAYTLFVLSTRASARAAPAGVDRPEAPLQDPRIEEAEAPPDPRIDEAAAKLSPERRRALEHLCERFPDVEPAQAADAIRMAQKYVTGGHNIESAAAATLGRPCTPAGSRART